MLTNQYSVEFQKITTLDLYGTSASIKNPSLFCTIWLDLGSMVTIIGFQEILNHIIIIETLTWNIHINDILCSSLCIYTTSNCAYVVKMFQIKVKKLRKWNKVEECR